MRRAGEDVLGHTGLDRLAMIMAGVPDIRYFTDNDQRFLAQF